MAIEKGSVQTYIDTLVTIFNTIAFDGSTLGDKGLVRAHVRAGTEHPLTEVYVFGDVAKLSRDGADTTDLFWTVRIGIYTQATGREVDAQQDNDYLTEQILFKIAENTTNTGFSGATFTPIDGEGITSTSLQVNKENSHYYRSITATFQQINAVSC